MSAEVRIPSLGVGMTEGTLVEWLAQDGATVAAGDLLYGLETEKTIQEIAAPVSGVLKVVAPAGDVYQVGDLVARIE